MRVESVARLIVMVDVDVVVVVCCCCLLLLRVVAMSVKRESCEREKDGCVCMD